MSHFTPPILPVKIFRQIKKFTFKITLQRKQTQKAECNFENSGVNTITVKQQFAYHIRKFTMQINKNIFPNMNFQCKKLKRAFRVKLKGHF